MDKNYPSKYEKNHSVYKDIYLKKTEESYLSCVL